MTSVHILSHAGRTLQLWRAQSPQMIQLHTRILRSQFRTMAKASPMRLPWSRLERPIFQRHEGAQIARRTFSNGPSRDTFHATYRSTSRFITVVMGVNGAIFTLWSYARFTSDTKLENWLRRNFTLSNFNFQEGRWHTLLTSTISHSNLIHFAFNMLALQAFASMIQLVPGIGAIHLGSLFFGSAIAGSIGFLYHNNSLSSSSIGGSTMSGRQATSALGASGMVMGVAATATCLIPRAPMMIFPIPFAIPLWILTGVYVGLDTYFLHSNSPVGHAAHLGGFAYGLFYYALYLRRFGGILHRFSRGMK